MVPYSRSKPFKLGRVLGIPIWAHYSWLPVIPIYTWAISHIMLPRTVPGLSLWIYFSLGTITTVLLFVSVLVHELAHSVMARAEGIETGGITLYMFGGLASLGGQPVRPSTEFKIAIAGPAASFLIGTLFFLLDQLLFRHTTHLALSQVLRHLGIVNWFLAGFNILPGLPLDGGRVLRAIVWKFNKNFREATRTANRAGITISLALIVGGVFLLKTDVVTALWSLTIGILLATMLYSTLRPRTAPGRRAIPGTIEGVMNRDVVLISPEIKVQDFIDSVLEHNHFTTFPVASDGRLHGLLMLKELKGVPRERWPALTAREVMRPVSDSMFLDSRTPIARARSVMESNGIGKVVVLDSNGLVIGYLSINDLTPRGL